MNTRYLLISAAIAGAVTAVLSTVPFINLLNCLLCAWMWLGGLFAVFLYRNQSKDFVDPGRGALIGVLTGLVGAVIAIILSLIFLPTSAAAALPPETMQQLEETLGEGAAALTSPAATTGISIISNLIFYPLFCTLGGLIGGAIFKNRPGPAI